ncbi:hypothetical protein NC652_002386 [Populus alba x Populus x berolinensis]|nr:hypothetical protein NC652_002386 [Populus alba x Populus x berolinensis]
MENEQTRSTAPPDQIDMKTASILSVVGGFFVSMSMDSRSTWKYFAVTKWKHIDVDEKVFKEVEFI